MDPEIKMKNMFLTGSYPDSVRQLSPCKFLSQIKSVTLPYPVSNWHIDPDIKLHEYVSNRILSGFYKAVVDLKIDKPN